MPHHTAEHDCFGLSGWGNAVGASMLYANSVCTQEFHLGHVPSKMYFNTFQHQISTISPFHKRQVD